MWPWWATEESRELGLWGALVWGVRPGTPKPREPPWEWCTVWRLCRLGICIGSVVKNLTAMRSRRIWSLGLEDPLEKGMASHSSVLAWRIQSHRSRSLVGYSPWGRKSRTWLSNLACMHLLANGAVINLMFRWFCCSIAKLCPPLLRPHGL